MLPVFHHRSNLPTILNFVDDLFGRELSPLSVSSPMKVDLVENEKSFVLKADLPGVSKEDIKVNLKDGVLSISVESKKEQETKEGEKVWRMERSYSKKERVFNFENRISEENISATYEHGVLTLELPKKDATVSLRQIEIK